MEVTKTNKKIIKKLLTSAKKGELYLESLNDNSGKYIWFFIKKEKRIDLTPSENKVFREMNNTGNPYINFRTSGKCQCWITEAGVLLLERCKNSLEKLLSSKPFQAISYGIISFLLGKMIWVNGNNIIHFIKRALLIVKNLLVS